MLNTKRGISPLIATVLIIGFTVALAAVIMTWGQSFQKDIAKSTEETTETQLACAQEVVFDITSACYSGSDVTVTMKNDGSRDLTTLSMRLYRGPNDVETVPLEGVGGEPALGKFQIETYDALGVTSPELINQIEVIPIIMVGEKEVTCSQSIAKFLDVNKADTLASCSP